MRKVFATLLIVTSSIVALAQAPVKTPELSLQQKYDLLRMEIKFVNVGQQLQALQQQSAELQKKYADYTKDLCKSAGSKQYLVDLAGEDPVCREISKPATTAVPAKK